MEPPDPTPADRQGSLVALDLSPDEAGAHVDAPDVVAARAERARVRRRSWQMLAVLLLLATTLRLPAFFVQVFNSDETFIATQAEVINDGGQLYRDAADRKPPLVPYLYAAVFAVTGTSALWSVRVAAMLAVVATAMLLGAEARRRWGERAAWVAALLFVCASVAFAPQDGQAANFEIFMLPAMTAAMLLAARGRSLGAGVAVAVATLAKQTGAATLIPVLYLVARARGKRGVGEALAGFGLPLGLVALLLGPADVVFWVVLGNGSYFGLGSASAYVLGLFLVMTLAFLACNLPIVWTLPRAWRDRRAQPQTELWLWLLSAALSVAVGFRFFGHYYLQLLPPLSLITAGALTRRPERVARVTVACAGIIAVGFSIFGFFVRPWADNPKYEAVSQYLDIHTTEADRIFVWGHMPEIYWASERLPASGILSSGFPVGDWGGRPEGDLKSRAPTEGTYEKMLADLRTNRPRYVLDTTGARIRGSQYAPMSDYDALQSFVDRGYRYVRTIDGIAIYARNPMREAARKE
jgi:MFS family permease